MVLFVDRGLCAYVSIPWAVEQMVAAIVIAAALVLQIEDSVVTFRKILVSREWETKLGQQETEGKVP